MTDGVHSPDEIFGDAVFYEILVKLDVIKRTAFPDQMTR